MLNYDEGQKKIEEEEKRKLKGQAGRLEENEEGTKARSGWGRNEQQKSVQP